MKTPFEILKCKFLPWCRISNWNCRWELSWELADSLPESWSWCKWCGYWLLLLFELLFKLFVLLLMLLLFKWCSECCSDSDGIRCGRLGLVGLANGLRELVLGGGGGGTFLARCNSSALRSGTGGLPVGRGGWGGLVSCVSVSDPDGYECKRRKPCVCTVSGYNCDWDNLVVMVFWRVCELSSDVESSGRP